MEKTRASQPRFRRPKERPSIQLTEDDYDILWHVYRHRLIDSKALYQLFPNRSDQVISRRLGRLFRTEHLDRPLNQNVKNRLKPGTDFFVYALAKEGARVLRDRFDAPISVGRWTEKNAKLAVSTIEHYLETSRFVTRLVAGVRTLPDARVLYLDELMPAELYQKRPAGLFTTIRADVPWFIHGQNEGTASDFIIGVEIAGELQVLFIEIDRATETIVPGDRQLKGPRFWRDTSFLRKKLIYGAAYKAKAHQRQFGLPVFRVLTVTTQSGRVASMQDAYKKHMARGQNHAPPGLFLYTDWQTVDAAENVLTMELETAGGRKVSLVSKHS